MQQTDEFGIVTRARLRAALFSQRHPQLERKIMGRRPVYLNAKETHITVNCATGERSFERIEKPMPAPKPVARPVAAPIPSGPPPAPFNDHWKTDEGKRQLALSEQVNILSDRAKIGDIMAAVAKVAGITTAQMCGASREKRFAHPRHIAMLLCRDLRPDLSMPKIGFLFNRDHTTVLHADRQSRRRVEESATHRGWYDRAKELLA